MKERGKDEGGRYGARERGRERGYMSDVVLEETKKLNYTEKQ